MSQTVIEVDVAIIGAGTAGLVARSQAFTHGAKRVLLIEGGPFGTTCARVGCMPSKLLIAAADAAEGVREAGRFGVRAAKPEIDGEAVMRRVQAERDRFAGFVVEANESLPPSHLLRGWARFVGPTSLEVAAEAGPVRVEAGAIVIAAGSKPWVPPPLRELGDRLLTTDEIFELPTLPGSLAVVGAGVIGLELGQAMSRLGVDVQLLDIGTRLPLVRSEVMQREAKAVLEARLALDLGVRDLAATRSNNGVELRWTDAAGQARKGVFEYVLAATGRRPQLARLELGAAGIELDGRGMPLHFDPRTMQIGDSPVFLAGDINGIRPLLHEAAAEGRFAGINAARFPEVRAHARAVELGIMFTDPNVAVVGEIPEAGPCHEGVEWEAGEVDYGNQGRARVIGENHGRARIYARHNCGTIIGAELVGPRAEHLAHLLAWSIEQGLTVPRALELPYYHPVIEEGLRTAISRLARKLKMGPKPRPLDCGPGT